jgi:hypothetical protein
MTNKFKLMWVLVLCITLTTVRGQGVTPTNHPVQLVVTDGFWGSDNGLICQTLLAFVVNNSNDTVKYWGHDAGDRPGFENCQYYDLFTVSENQYLHLVDTGCNNIPFKRTTIPPNRSQLIPLELSVENSPDTTVLLNIDLKLYFCYGSGSFEENKRNNNVEILRDSVMLKFHKGEFYNTGPTEDRKTKFIPPLKDLHLLSDSERMFYKIVIDESKIKKAPNWDYSNTKKGKGLLVPVTIYNNSNTVLKYFTWGCSFDEFYHINNDNFEVPGSPCETNSLIIISVEPHQSHTDIVHITFKGKKIKQTEKFKLGLNINEKIPSFYLVPFLDQLKQYNIVWSDEVLFTPK